MANILYKGGTVYYKGFPVYYFKSGGYTPPPVDNISRKGPDNPSSPTATPPSIVTTYTPTSSADLSNAANANKIAIISNSFSATGITLAVGQIIRPAGGQISGTGINLNGAFIEENALSAFSNTARFSSLYDKSRLKPETFGGVSGVASDDSDAIEALILNCKYAGATLNGSYIANKPKSYTRSDLFNWNMNGAKVSITDNTNFRINTFDVDYLMDFTNTVPEIYNGEFDGTEVYGRCFWLKGQSSFYFADLVVHNFYSTTNARGVAFKFDLKPTTKGFTIGEFYRNTIDNISSEKNGNANDAYGLSKGILMYITEAGNSNFYSYDNVYTNFKGDDAECVYIAPYNDVGQSHGTKMYFTNDEFKYAKRRQAKITSSNVSFKSCVFQSPLTEQEFNGQAVAMLGAFSTISGQPAKNIEVIDCDFIATGAFRQNAIAITDVEGFTVKQSRINFADVANVSGINFGTGTAGYSGLIKDCVFEDITFTNCGMNMGGTFNVEGGLVFDNMTFNYAPQGNTPGNHIAILRFIGASTINEQITLKNSVVNYNAVNSMTLFDGLIVSFASTLENLTIENVQMNYTGSGSIGNVFGYIGVSETKDFGSTNLIKDVTINGKSGTGALRVTGTVKNPQIVNSSGNGNPITVQ